MHNKASQQLVSIFFKVQQQTTWDHMGETISATYFAKYSRLCLLTTTGSNF